MTRNQHCQHFASSLVQEESSSCPPPQPPAPLTRTLHKGRVLLQTLRSPTPACLTPAGTGRLDPQRGQRAQAGPASAHTGAVTPSFHEECQACCDVQGSAGPGPWKGASPPFTKP